MNCPFNSALNNLKCTVLHKLTGRVEGPAEKARVWHIATYALLKAAGAWQKLCLSCHWEKTAKTSHLCMQNEKHRQLIHNEPSPIKLRRQRDSIFSPVFSPARCRWNKTCFSTRELEIQIYFSHLVLLSSWQRLTEAQMRSFCLAAGGEKGREGGKGLQ